MPIQIEFRYQAQDMPEAVETAFRRIRQVRPLFKWRILLAWLFVVTSAALVIHFDARKNTRRHYDAAIEHRRISQDEMGSIAGMAVGMAIVFIVTYAFSRWYGRRLARHLISLEMLQSVVADEKGIIWTQPDTIVEHRWSGIHGFDETPRLFVIYQSDPRQAKLFRFLTIPKRAFPSPQLIEEFAQLLNAHACRNA